MSSLGYAERLSYREDLGGQLGSKELNDRPDDVVRSVELLAAWVSAAICCLGLVAAQQFRMLIVDQLQQLVRSL
jgi:hypothetical protein